MSTLVLPSGLGIIHQQGQSKGNAGQVYMVFASITFITY